MSERLPYYRIHNETSELLDQDLDLIEDGSEFDNNPIPHQDLEGIDSEGGESVIGNESMVDKPDFIEDDLLEPELFPEHPLITEFDPESVSPTVEDMTPNPEVEADREEGKKYSSRQEYSLDQGDLWFTITDQDGQEQKYNLRSIVTDEALAQYEDLIEAIETGESYFFMRTRSEFHDTETEEGYHNADIVIERDEDGNVINIIFNDWYDTEPKEILLPDQIIFEDDEYQVGEADFQQEFSSPPRPNTSDKNPSKSARLVTIMASPQAEVLDKEKDQEKKDPPPEVNKLNEKELDPTVIVKEIPNHVKPIKLAFDEKLNVSLLPLPSNEKARERPSISIPKLKNVQGTVGELPTNFEPLPELTPDSPSPMNVELLSGKKTLSHGEQQSAQPNSTSEKEKIAPPPKVQEKASASTHVATPQIPSDPGGGINVRLSAPVTQDADNSLQKIEMNQDLDIPAITTKAEQKTLTVESNENSLVTPRQTERSIPTMTEVTTAEETPLLQKENVTDEKQNYLKTEPSPGIEAIIATAIPEARTATEPISLSKSLPNGEKRPKKTEEPLYPVTLTKKEPRSEMEPNDTEELLAHDSVGGNKNRLNPLEKSAEPEEKQHITNKPVDFPHSSVLPLEEIKTSPNEEAKGSSQMTPTTALLDDIQDISIPVHRKSRHRRKRPNEIRRNV